MDTVLDHESDSKVLDKTAMHPSMWISVVNICVQNDKTELAEKAKARFEASFDWRNELDTDIS